MTVNTTSERENFWKILFYLEELKKTVPLNEFLEMNQVSKDEFILFVETSHQYGLNLSIKETPEQVFVSPLSFYREFGDMAIEGSLNKEIAREIQECIVNNEVCELIFSNFSHMHVYPWKVLFFENRLSIIAEDIKTKRLLTIDIDEIESFKVTEKKYKSLFSRLEVEDFVSSMRLVAGSDERLILKIKHGEHISLPSEYIFLGNPYTTTNQYGDLIWAATVERSPYLFEWLYSIRDKIEILDPTSILGEFDDFCTKKKAA